MYVVKASKWDHDGNFRITKNSRQHMYEFRADTIKEAMRNYMDMKNNNDMTKFTPLDIYDVINTTE